MSKKIFIASTLPTAQSYNLWKNTENKRGLPTLAGRVVIEGGAGVANKNLVTPKGVVTEITEDQLKMLSNDKVFQRHQKRGFITVVDSLDGEKAAKDMNQEDNSKPLNEEKIQKKTGRKTKASTGKASDSDE